MTHRSSIRRCRRMQKCPRSRQSMASPRIVKALPNAFAGTDLAEQLRATDRPEIIFVGMQTHMCISASVRAALNHGFRSTVVADACATRDLPDGTGGRISTEAVHRAALAELADAFAIVVPSASAWQDVRLDPRS